MLSKMSPKKFCHLLREEKTNFETCVEMSDIRVPDTPGAPPLPPVLT